MPALREAHYRAGRRCPKALWLLAREAPETAFAPMDAGERARLLRLAVEVLPGPAVAVAGDLEDRLRLTRAGLKQGQPMLGAALAHEGWVAEPDYLGPHPRGGWELLAAAPQVSVSKSTLERLAWQAAIAHGAGVELAGARVLTLNSHYCRAQRLEVPRLLEPHTVTAAVSARSRRMDEELAALAAIPRLKEAPVMALGPQCEQGGGCPFKPRCWAGLPEHNVFHLHQISRKKAFELCHAGRVALELLPKGLRTRHREAQCFSAQTGRPFVDHAALRRFLARLEYPLHCLDFETVNAAVPWLPGLRPFDMIPVQFSLSRVPAPGAPPEHETFICSGQSDPRLPLLDRLKSGLGRRGSIVAYHAAFERTVIQGLVAGNRAGERWQESLRDRWVDLLEPFKHYHFHDIRQKGSASLKAVLPAVTGRGYEDLAIRDGWQATQAWLRLIFEAMPAGEAARLREDLTAYCRRDTEGLVWIIEALQRLV